MNEVDIPSHKRQDVVQPFQGRIHRAPAGHELEWHEARVPAYDSEVAQLGEAAPNDARAAPLRLDECKRQDVRGDGADKCRHDAVVLLIQVVLRGLPVLRPSLHGQEKFCASSRLACWSRGGHVDIGCVDGSRADQGEAEMTNAGEGVRGARAFCVKALEELFNLGWAADQSDGEESCRP